MFRLLDENDDGYISTYSSSRLFGLNLKLPLSVYAEFLRIVDLLNLNIKKLDHSPTIFERVVPSLYNSFPSQLIIKLTQHRYSPIDPKEKVYAHTK